MIFYFSGTGNSRHVAKRLATLTDDSCITLADHPNLASSPLQAEEPLGLVFPAHGWNIPSIVKAFVQNFAYNLLETNIKQQESSHYIYIVATCGDDTGRLLQQCSNLLSFLGVKLSSAWAVQMPNTYVCLPGFNVDSPLLVEQKLRQSMKEVENIAICVRKRQKGIFSMRPGTFPTLKTYILGPIFYKVLITDRHFHTTPSCTLCGTCVRHCPVGNLTIDHGRLQWQHRCTMCLACFHSCPRRAIRYGWFTKNKGQYLFHPHLLPSV